MKLRLTLHKHVEIEDARHEIERIGATRILEELPFHGVLVVKCQETSAVQKLQSSDLFAYAQPDEAN